MWTLAPSLQDKAVRTPQKVRTRISKMDIFLGRGTLYAKHPGNSLFYQVIDGFLDQYEKARCKIEKTDIIKMIYDRIKECGQRFLKEDSLGSGIFTEAFEDEGKKKIGHTLRYRQKRRMKSKSRSTLSLTEFTRTQTWSEHHGKASSPVAVVTPLPSPSRRATKKKTIQDIFSDDELESVLGIPPPSQLDSPEEPSIFVLQPSCNKTIPLEELGLGLAAFGFEPY